MERKKKRIRGRCALYACRFCRTKAGWPHQVWCGIAGKTDVTCADCLYRTASGCGHPRKKERKGETNDAKDPCML